MICYYRNDISCGANRMEFKDQIVIRGKLDQIGVRPIRVSHFGDFWRALREEEEEKRRRIEEEKKKRKKKKKKKKKKRKGTDCYGFVWITMGLYGFVDFCMDISLFHF